MFDKLKNDYGFIPKNFHYWFNKASAKALKQVFPKVYIIKCFFHFVKCLGKYLKKYSLLDQENKKNSFELLFNLKRLSFIEPNNIFTLYKKINKKYNNNKYKKFLHILKITGNQ